MKKSRFLLVEINENEHGSFCLNGIIDIFSLDHCVCTRRAVLPDSLQTIHAQSFPNAAANLNSTNEYFENRWSSDLYPLGCDLLRRSVAVASKP